MELSEKLKRFDDINEVLYKSKDRANYWILNNSNIIDDFIESLSSEELTSELFESYIYNKLKDYYEKSHDTEALFKSLSDEDKPKMTYFFYIHGKLANNGYAVYSLSRNVSEKMYYILKNILLKNKYYYVWFQLDDINANNMLSGRNRYSNTPYVDNALSYILRNSIGDVRFNYLLLPDDSNPEEINIYDRLNDTTQLISKNRVVVAEKILDEFLSLETEHKICSDVVVRAICDVVLQYSLNAKDYADKIKESKNVIFSSYSNFNILATNKNISDEDSRSIIAQSFRQKDINKYIKSLRESKDMNVISAFLDGGVYNNTRIKSENKDKRAMEILTAVLIGTPSRYYNDITYEFKNNNAFWTKYPNLRSAMEDYCINALYEGKYGKVATCIMILCKAYSYLNVYEYFTKFTNILSDKIKEIEPHLHRYLMFLPTYIVTYNNENMNKIKDVTDILTFDNVEKIYMDILNDYKEDPNFKPTFIKYFKIMFRYLTTADRLSAFFNDTIRKVFNKDIKTTFSRSSNLYSYLMKKHLLSISTIGKIDEELGYPLKDSYVCEYENILERNFFNDKNGFNPKNNVFTDPAMLIACALKDTCIDYNRNTIDNISFSCPEEFVFAPNIQFVGSKMMYYSKADKCISGEITKNMYSIFNNINKMLYILNLYLTDFDNYQSVVINGKIEDIENYLISKEFKFYPIIGSYYSAHVKIYYNEDLHIAISASDLYEYGTLFSATSVFNKFDEIKKNIAKKYLEFLASDNFISACTLEWISLYSDMKNKGTFNPDFNTIDYSDRYSSGDSIKYEIHFNESYYIFLEKFIKSLHINQIIELSGLNTEFTEEYILNRLNENRPEIELAATIMD